MRQWLDVFFSNLFSDPDNDELVGVLIMKKNSSAVVKYDEVRKKAREEAKRLLTRVE